MPKLFVTDRGGTQIEIEGEAGLSVMKIIRNAGFDEMLALCGGECACATCHVFVDQANWNSLRPMEEDENDLLDSSDHRQANSRLACQLKFGPELEGLRVQIGPDE